MVRERERERERDRERENKKTEQKLIKCNTSTFLRCVYGPRDKKSRP